MNKMKLTTITYFLLMGTVVFSTISCAEAGRISYRYFDGSANAFAIKDSTIEYIPIRAEQSSSGIYSGGEHVKKKISVADLEIVESLIKKAIAATSEHIKNRVMMSGLIVIQVDDKKESYILAPKSGARLELESKLKELLAVE